MRARNVIYWIGWIMAAIGYMVVVIDIALCWLVPAHRSILYHLFTAGTPEAFMLLCWCASAVICLTAKD